MIATPKTRSRPARSNSIWTARTCRLTRSASAPAGNENRSHGSCSATATVATRTGLLVSATASSGKATKTIPSPRADAPVALSIFQYRPSREFLGFGPVFAVPADLTRDFHLMRLIRKPAFPPPRTSPVSPVLQVLPRDGADTRPSIQLAEWCTLGPARHGHPHWPGTRIRSAHIVVSEPMTAAQRAYRGVLPR